MFCIMNHACTSGGCSVHRFVFWVYHVCGPFSVGRRPSPSRVITVTALPKKTPEFYFYHHQNSFRRQFSRPSLHLSKKNVLVATRTYFKTSYFVRCHERFVSSGATHVEPSRPSNIDGLRRLFVRSTPLLLFLRPPWAADVPRGPISLYCVS